jgi:hypothetical protein
MTKPELELSVLRANADFYRAFSHGDYAAMDRLWAQTAPVSCLHPGAPALIGRAQVMDSWGDLLRQPPPFMMRSDHARARILGETAIVLCYEGNGEHPAHLAATNVFVLEGGAWRMVHHQAGPLARPIELPANMSN